MNALKKGFTLIELMVVIAIIGLLSAIVLGALNSSKDQAQDSTRISEIRQIQYALALYFNDHGVYPTCLYGDAGCVTSLEGSVYMPEVPVDPLGVEYTYAAIGSGLKCSTYHLGVSLLNKKNIALQMGADATRAGVCTGSALDFSGLSYTAAGVECDAIVGKAQPTTNSRGETCYDVVP